MLLEWLGEESCRKQVSYPFDLELHRFSLIHLPAILERDVAGNARGDRTSRSVINVKHDLCLRIVNRYELRCGAFRHDLPPRDQRTTMSGIKTLPCGSDGAK